MSRFSDAIPALREAIRIKPDYAEANQELGYAYLNVRQYQDAVAAFRQAIRLKPDYALAHYNLGITYLSMDNKSGAMSEYRTLTSIDKQRADKLLAEINK